MVDSSLLPGRLALLHAWVRRQSWLARFTLMNRILLAMAFIPTGLVKVTGNRFTTLPVDNPVGFFFEAMYQTGPYWYFIGFMQVLAGLLLLIPRAATLGALLFFPIGLSVFLVTWGIGFGGTVWVTLGMLLAVLYLIGWDAHRVWAAALPILSKGEKGSLLAGATAIEKAGWVLGASMGLALFLTTRGFVPASWRPGLFFVGVGAALMVFVGWIVQVVRDRRRSVADLQVE